MIVSNARDAIYLRINELLTELKKKDIDIGNSFIQQDNYKEIYYEILEVRHNLILVNKNFR